MPDRAEGVPVLVLPIETTRTAARAASLHRLHGLIRAMNGDLDLDRTLLTVCRGLVEGLGFGVAVVNLVMPDGDLEIVVVEGEDDARTALLGQRGTRPVWDAWLARCEQVGDLLVDYRHAEPGHGVPFWVPDIPASGVEGAWHPADALLAPLRTPRSGLLGVISVDLPADRRRPGRDQLELLEMYAAQASIAVENAQLHSTLKAQDALHQRALGRLSAVVDSAPVAIIELDLAGLVRLWNDAAEKIFGWTAAEVLGHRNPVAPDGGYDSWLQTLQSDNELHRTTTYRLRRDGSRVDVEMTSSSLLDDEGGRYGYLGVYVDVSHRRKLEQELRTAAYTDPLTGLANRSYFNAHVDTDAGDVGVVLLDLDGFKAVNDTLGHAVGDLVLVDVARRLRAVCRDEDLIARLGGDEFVVSLARPAGNVDPRAAAEQLAGRLVEVLAEPFEVAGRLVSLGASVGLAYAADLAHRSPEAPPVSPGGGRDELLRDADVAMYAAKAAGKGQVRVFEPALRDRVVRTSYLTQDLRGALARGELFLRWQPVVEVPTGRILTLEGLIRWQHPVLGELLPGTFIGLAEETGLIVAIGAHVVREACEALRRWHGMPCQRALPAAERISVAVNLSPVQVAATGLVDTVRDCVSVTRVPPGNVVLELTEDVLLRDVDQAVTVLRELRELGVRLAVDDFGVGYASLSYLTRLPLNAVKLDRSLLTSVRDDPAALSVLDAVLALTRRLGLATIAEGVETYDQWLLLSTLGCPLAQGFLIARPVVARQVPELLDRGLLPPPPPPVQTAPPGPTCRGVQPDRTQRGHDPPVAGPDR